MKLAFFLGDTWLFVAILLIVLSTSRWLFDKPVKDHKKIRPSALYLRRVGLSLVWPLAILSGGGRRTILHIMKGE